MAGYRPANRGNRSASRTGATVSRRLRAAGWNISPAARRHVHDGVFVKAMDSYVSVLVDTGLDARNERTAKGIGELVAAWPQVSDVETDVMEDGAVFVRFTYSS